MMKKIWAYLLNRYKSEEGMKEFLNNFFSNLLAFSVGIICLLIIMSLTLR